MEQCGDGGQKYLQEDVLLGPAVGLGAVHRSLCSLGPGWTPLQRLLKAHGRISPFHCHPQPPPPLPTMAICICVGELRAACRAKSSGVETFAERPAAGTWLVLQRCQGEGWGTSHPDPHLSAPMGCPHHPSWGGRLHADSARVEKTESGGIYFSICPQILTLQG